MSNWWPVDPEHWANSVLPVVGIIVLWLLPFAIVLGLAAWGTYQ